MITILILSLLLVVGIVSTITISVLATTSPNSNTTCEPSYPEICVPKGEDINCADISSRIDIIVLPPDPAGLDRDKNGIGCES